MNKKYAVVTFLLLLVLFGVGIFSLRSDIFQLSSVAIFPTDESVNKASFQFIKKKALLKLSKHMNEPLLLLNLKKITSELSKESWIENIRVTRALPNKLKIWLEPKEVVFVLLDEKGKVHPIAVDGSVLKSFKKETNPDVPVLTGRVLREQKLWRQKAINLIGLLPERGILGRASFSELTYSAKDGLVAYLVEDRIKVIFGKNVFSTVKDVKNIADQMESIPDQGRKEELRRLDHLRQVLSYIHTKGVNVRVIDSRLSKKVLVRLRKEL